MTKFPDFTDDYRNLSQNIHAPAHLQTKVLDALREGEAQTPQKARKGGRYSRGFSLLQKAAVAALIVLLIPVTAFAAVKVTAGVREWVALYGVKDMEAVETLVNTFPSLPEETVSTPEGYAEYNILEAVCDSQNIFVTAEIRPLTDEYFFLSNDLGYNDSMGYMQMEGYEGDPSMLIEDYAASLGKEIMMVGVNLYDADGNPLPLGKYSTCKKDGTIYQYFDGPNPYDTQTFPVTVLCTYSTKDMPIAERFEYQIQMSDNSTRTPVKTFTQFSDISELNVQMQELVIEKTELGYLATFTYAASRPYHISLLDAEGNYLRTLPGGTRMPTNNGDGTYCVTISLPEAPPLEGLQFQLVGGDIEKSGLFQILG